MSSTRALACAGVLLALATVFGAFGAHALKGQLSVERLQLWDTAVRYHFFQALGLLAVALTLRLIDDGTGVPRGAAALRAAAVLLAAGVVLFSGSLYALALTGARNLGMLTPVGGAAWLLAWLVVAKAMLARAP